MGKTNAYRTEALFRRVGDGTMPASDTTYTIDLPAGFYELTVSIKSNVTGSTSAVSARPFVDAAQTQVSSGTSGDYRFWKPADTTPQASLVVGTAGAQGTIGRMTSTASSLFSPFMNIPHGLQFTIIKGTATTGQTFEVDVLATRVM